MKEKTTKMAFRAFLDMTHDKEELWLSRMADQGWFLKKILLAFYRFEKREPSPTVYRIDYRGSAKVDRKEYLGLFKDAGWEFVTAVSGRFYFRTKAGAVPVPEIFTDKDSLLAMYRRIVAGAGLFFIIIALDLYHALSSIRAHPGWFFIVWQILASLIVVALGYGLARLLVRIKRIKKGQFRPASDKAK